MNQLDTKGYVLYYFIYIKFLLKAKLQREKVDWWLPEIRGEAGMDGRWVSGNFVD